jgi:hypothetical protein
LKQKAFSERICVGLLKVVGMGLAGMEFQVLVLMPLPHAVA